MSKRNLLGRLVAWLLYAIVIAATCGAGFVVLMARALGH